MEEFISKNMFRKKLELFCGSEQETYIGIVEQVVDNVIVITNEAGKRIYVSADKVVSFRELD